jgi:hypothetical protein
MKPSEVTEFVAMIADAFPERFRATPGVTRLWASMLVDLPAQEALSALQGHIAESPHVPTIADVRNRVARARTRADEVDVGAAWGEVQRAIGRVGYAGAPTWSHPAIEHAVEALGWRAICHTLEGDVPTLRAQFERYFRGYLDGARRAANVGALEEHRRSAGALGAGELVAGLLKPKGGA